MLLHSLLYFFFYCYVGHRDLHSFPTRRSSDLVRSSGLARGHGGARRRGALGESTPQPRKRGRPRRNDARHLAAGVLGEGRDRKSTRLNSSHGYISYAVFCLKKKKQQKDNVNGD